MIHGIGHDKLVLESRFHRWVSTIDKGLVESRGLVWRCS